ncbi:MAG: hypothetical protein COX19_04900 [Desulfobacterales bacterium CG23_combo_of_CG06-09_8_20_14_all_51_8]|nr:MAG: hypothetical protein COX19_04900 [Desulfobacterales bacterium CG23_combo_of_CG06-09_8_20_14_all_51_8]
MTFYFDIFRIPDQIIKGNVRILQLILKTYSTRNDDIIIGPEDLISASDWTCFIDSLIQELSEIRNEGENNFKNT